MNVQWGRAMICFAIFMCRVFAMLEAEAARYEEPLIVVVLLCIGIRMKNLLGKLYETKSVITNYVMQSCEKETKISSIMKSKLIKNFKILNSYKYFSQKLLNSKSYPTQPFSEKSSC